MRATISAAGSTCSGTQPLRLPTSMNSIRRSSSPCCRASSARGSSWSALPERVITAFSFRAPRAGSKPASLACRIAASTFSSTASPAAALPRPAMRATLAPSVPSRLRVIRSSPAAFSCRARSAPSSTPLLGRAISRRAPRGSPGSRCRSGCRAAISSSRRRCSRGSPPVRRRVCTPRPTVASTRASRSGRVSRSGGSSRSGQQ